MSTTASTVPAKRATRKGLARKEERTAAEAAVELEEGAVVTGLHSRHIINYLVHIIKAFFWGNERNLFPAGPAVRRGGGDIAADVVEPLLFERSNPKLPSVTTEMKLLLLLLKLALFTGVEGRGPR